MSKLDYQWCIYVDIEGFGKRFDNGAKNSMVKLTDDLFRIGKQIPYLSINQFGGDGFLIKEVLLYSNNYTKAVDLAVVLMKSILVNNGVGKIAISFGSMSDIQGLYSNDLRQSIKNSGSNNVLDGYNSHMLINPVTGDAIIKSHKLSTQISGPLLLIDPELKERLENENIPHELISLRNGKNALHINWITYNSETVQKHLSSLNYSNFDFSMGFKNYLHHNTDLPVEWISNAKLLLS